MHIFAFNLYLSILLGCSSFVWLLSGLFHFGRQGKWKWFRFRFSHFHYYLSVSPLLLATGLLSFFTGRYFFLIAFGVFGLAGVIGETWFSWYWHHLFGKRFWTYQVDVLLRGFTSWLNFIPWGMGGMLYIGILSLLFHYNSNFLMTLPLIRLHHLDLGFLVIFVITFSFIFLIKKTHYPFTIFTYTWFCLPMLIPLAYLAYWSKDFLYIALLFGSVAFLAEYVFGKALQLFISKKLWSYSYWTFDHQHGTPLTLLPFAFGGFCAWFIYLSLSSL